MTTRKQMRRVLVKRLRRAERAKLAIGATWSNYDVCARARRALDAHDAGELIGSLFGVQFVQVRASGGAP